MRGNLRQKLGWGVRRGTSSVLVSWGIRRGASLDSCRVRQSSSTLSLLHMSSSTCLSGLASAYKYFCDPQTSDPDLLSILSRLLLSTRFLF